MPDVSDLTKILDLEQLEQNLFRGRVPQVGWQRVFGGLVIAQALAAARRTVAGREPHSLHAYFLLGGDPAIPIVYDVERLRDGRSFTTRRVVAIQHGRAIFAMSVSFHAAEPGFEHQAPMPDVPMPEDLPAYKELSRAQLDSLPLPVRAYFERERPIEIRPCASERYTGAARGMPADAGARVDIWIRATHRLGDDPGLHQCVLAYASDLTLLDASLAPHHTSVFDPGIAPASLDHAMWFHNPFRADEWMLYAQDTPHAGGARGFSRGLLFRRDGGLIASVAQEGLIRQVQPKK